MKAIIRLFTALGLSLAVITGQAMASGSERKNAEDYDFSFEGPFGKFDRAQLQRGWLVYKEVCHNCHSLKYIRFRNLAEPGGPEFTEKQAKAIAAEFEVEDGPNDEGEMFTRPGRLSDAVPSPYPNEEAAKAANNGAVPPDLSLIVKAREGWDYPWYISPIIKLFKGNGGAEYVRSLIAGYQDPPAGEEVKEGLNYNPYFPGHWLAMPPPLAGEDVEYADGTKPTLIQEATDVAAFLAWASMPKMEERKRIGLMALLYMGVFALLMLMVKQAIWSRIKH
ncbi:cytochrome c1 [Thermopetrobacter sp. TC1]|uniref:cytochrome c1 n=1 Tax=Thermopetrobacter sp. TC1 TaxID=1495045 RepID=UPI00056F97C7|nr:cytochrome c1 [Thermopetrobacter sp. TC1]